MRLLALAALLLAAPATSLAGFHQGMACGECHTRMASEKFGNSIRPQDEEAVCLRCHDDSRRAPDVMGAALGAGGARVVRPGGGLNAVGMHANGYDEFSGHTIGTELPPPGFLGSWPAGTRLTCKSCHAVHDNGNYRNLGADPFIKDPRYRELADALFPATAEPTWALVAPTDEGVQADVLVASGAAPYDAGRILLSTNGGRNAMNQFCAACHGAFHGTGNTEDGRWTGKVHYVRHPTSGVEISREMQHRIARSYQPVRLARREDGTPEVACLTCHRAHGTTNAFGLVYWDPRSSDNGENGSARAMEPLCSTCHTVADESSVAARPRMGLPGL
jgi:predicted CXXCH cytochrome family protein